MPCPRSRLRIWSRETGSAVPSRVSLLILYTQGESGAYSRDSSRFPRRRPFIYTAIGSVPILLGHAVAYRWLQKSASTRPVVLKGVPVTCADFDHTPINVRLYFSTPNIGTYCSGYSGYSGYSMSDTESIGGVVLIAPLLSFPLINSMESTSYIFFPGGIFLPCDHGLDFRHKLMKEFNQSHQ